MHRQKGPVVVVTVIRLSPAPFSSCTGQPATKTAAKINGSKSLPRQTLVACPGSVAHLCHVRTSARAGTVPPRAEPERDMARRRTTQTTDDPQTTDTAATAGTATTEGTDAANAEAPAPPPARRGRRPRTDSNGNAGEAATSGTLAGAAPAPAATTDTDLEPPQQPRQQQQRRRRRRTIDTAAEASLLIAAVLRQRGAAGASQDELQQVVAWGRNTRLEGQQLQRGGQKEGRRTRRPSEEAMVRAQRSELNTLLLERVLQGNLGLDVRDGQLVFRRQEL